MSGDWIGYVLTAVGTLGTIGLGMLTWKVTHRTQQATERNQAHEQDDRLLASYKGGVETFERLWNTERAEREKLQQRVDSYRVEQLQMGDEHEQTKHELRDLQSEVERLKGRLIAALNYIREMLAWAASVQHSIPHPAVPDTIAHLIDTRDQPPRTRP